jgi:hypothetical protein
MKKQNEFDDLPKLSIYRYENFFNIYNDAKSDVKFYNLLKNINIFPAENSIVEEEYIFKQGDSWGKLSYDFYNTIDLWWLICEYNQIKNPLKLPESGTTIKILKSEYVSLVLSELTRQVSR